jgi:hypothetical protein
MVFNASSIVFVKTMSDCAVMVTEAEPRSLNTRLSQPEDFSELVGTILRLYLNEVAGPVPQEVGTQEPEIQSQN